ncbi:ABC transporter ATP-binding protein [Staphylococcus felis]|uniref:ABC transporter ATP-binding protein n=1 Tax=Staphylococcus felis TaxID=46127 RepID=UPI000E263D53|nr:ATP-binding cassette domain-containing protein [Staphylococcus felis]REH78649.1 multidrug ABC transporter ATP-binding protein [Staphylococcus felis]REH93509.1 multidrug ABC transporter ATP-binding protein [Staphylococcus felis]REI05735.1 multidrug ABC transporter ATP-binding protein [Staphylococcus felis]REI27698.1 multidrug ABC transporter ATP-binding protein [Staphylococcus felis]
MTQLKANNIYKSFKKKNVLKDVNIEINFGEIHGLIGRNGAGKSTLMKILTGLVNQDSGSFDFVNKDGENLLTTGLIESPALYPFLNSVENIKKYNALFNKDISNKDILFFLKIVGLESIRNKKIKNYSLGMKQRLGLAQVFSIKPDFLVLDEPFNGLDPEITIRIKNYLLSLKKEGKCILISSHQLNELDKLCDYISILNNGELFPNINKNIYNEISKYKIETNNSLFTEAILKRNNIKVSYADNNCVIFSTSRHMINDILNKLINVEISVYSVTPSKKTLEEIFLEYNG